MGALYFDINNRLIEIKTAKLYGNYWLSRNLVGINL